MNCMAKMTKSIVSAVIALVLSLAAYAGDYQEIPATVTEVDLPGNAVTFFGLGLGEVEYRFAYDLEIRLLGGGAGTVGNLRPGDGVTALVDEGNRTVHAIYVVSSDE